MKKKIKLTEKITTANTTYYDMSVNDHTDIIIKMEALYKYKQNDPTFTKRSSKWGFAPQDQKWNSQKTFIEGILEQHTTTTGINHRKNFSDKQIELVIQVVNEFNHYIHEPEYVLNYGFSPRPDPNTYHTIFEEIK